MSSVLPPIYQPLTANMTHTHVFEGEGDSKCACGVVRGYFKPRNLLDLKSRMRLVDINSRFAWLKIN